MTMRDKVILIGAIVLTAAAIAIMFITWWNGCDPMCGL